MPNTTHIRCSNCGRAVEPDALDFRCRTCGGMLDFDPFPSFDPARVDPAQPGIWRFRHALGVPDDAPIVHLGEGNTPLIAADTGFGQVHFKLEFANPTGSFKDRGTAPLAARLLAAGVERAVEDSSGNAGASFAAYAARAGIRARVFVPDYASGPKRAQIEAYGAEVVQVPGPRSETAAAVLREAQAGAVYASHAYLPYHQTGYATLAYELVDQLAGEAPAAVIAPAGQGTLLLGIGRGFKNLKSAGLIDRLPRLIGVQAMACAPLWAVFTMGPAGLQWVTEGQSIAEGIRVRNPVSGDLLLQMLAESGGTMVAVEEEAIHTGRTALAALGLYVEPTSAVVWDGLRQYRDWAGAEPGPVAVVLTGSGLKSPA